MGSIKLLVLLLLLLLAVLSLSLSLQALEALNRANPTLLPV
jgi:hypothetical protein